MTELKCPPAVYDVMAEFADEEHLAMALIDTRKKLDVCEECCREWETDYHLEFEKSTRLENQLKDTKKKLDKAIWWLNEIVENHRFTPISTAEKALAEIESITKGGKDE